MVALVEGRQFSLYCTFGRKEVPTKSADSEVCEVF